MIMLGLCLTVPVTVFSQNNNNTPMEALTSSKIETQQFFIDKFIVPQNAKREFIERMNVNRNFIKNLPGFIEDNVYERTDEHGNLIIVTVAMWENEDAIKNAKGAVQALYQKEGFDMQGFLKRLNIVIDRGQYKKSKN